MGGPVIDVGSTTRCGADSALVDWIVDTVMVAAAARASRPAERAAVTRGQRTLSPYGG